MHKPAFTPPLILAESRSGLDSQPFSQAQPPQQHNTTTSAATMSRTGVTQRNHHRRQSPRTTARLSAALLLLLIGLTGQLAAQEITLSAENASITEGQIARFIITPSAPPSVNIFIFSSISATGNFGVTTFTDMGSASILANSTVNAGIQRTTTNDAVDEPDGSITMTLTRLIDNSNNPVPGATIGSPSTVTITVLDDDTAPVVANEIDDQSLEAGNSVDIDISATFADKDTLTYAVVSDDSSIATATLSGTTLTVTGVAGGSTDITLSATDPDDASNNGAETVSDTFSVSVTAPGITFSSDDLTVDEGTTTTYTVVLDAAPTDDVTVTPTSGNTDAATVSSALTFTTSNWDTAQTVTVTGVDDANGDDETFNISHLITTTDSGYGSVTGNVGVTTSDDDIPAGVTLSATALTVDEGDTTTYTVVLDAAPTDDVTVTPTSGNTDAATVSGALTFTTSNWDTAQTVTVTGVDDDNNAVETLTITHAATSDDSNYTISDAGTVSVTTTDDDTLPPDAPTITVTTPGTFVNFDWAPALDYNDNGCSVSGYAVLYTIRQVGGGFERVIVSNLNRGISLTNLLGSPSDVDDGEFFRLELYANSAICGNQSAPTVITYRPSDASMPETMPDQTVQAGATIMVDASTATAFTSGGFMPEADAWQVTSFNPQVATASIDTSGVVSVTGVAPGETSIRVQADQDSMPRQVPRQVSFLVQVTPPTPPGLTFSSTSLTVDEGDTTTYTVVLDAAPTDDVTVSPTSGDPDAATVSGALTFTTSNWDTPQTVTITGVDDANGDDETFTITHAATSDDSNYTISDAGTVSVTTGDDDTGGVTPPVTGGQPGVTAAAANDDRTETTVTFSETVVLNTIGTPNADDADDWLITQSGATITPTAISIPIATANGTTTVTLTHAALSTAAASLSYGRGINEIISATSLPIANVPRSANQVRPHIPDGNTGAGFTATAANTFFFASPGFLDSAILNDAQLLVEAIKDGILDRLGLTALDGTSNDVPDTLAEIIPWMTGLGITFSSCTGTGAGACFGNTRIFLSNISIANGIPIVLPPGLTFSSTSLTVDEGDTTEYTIVLNAAPTDDVTVTPTSGNTDAATVTGALTFTDSNWNTAQTVTVTGVDDDNGVSETFDITHTASGGGYGSVTGTVAVTITDDDTAGVTLSPTSGSAGEDGGTTEYTVVLDTQPTGSVTITPTSGTLTTATVSGALTFTDSNWDTAQTITVTGVNDDIANASDRTATISHAASGYGSVTVGDYSFTATDDDTAGVTLSATSGNATENGGTASYTVVLDSEPSGNVTITPTSGTLTTATVSGALTFTDSNWDTAQTITVTGVNDDIDSDRTATISHTASGYGSVTVGNFIFTASDDDTDGLTFTPGSVNVGEASTVDYTVVLDTQPSGNVTVTPTSGNTDAATVSPATLIFTDSNWDTAQTITVTGVDDANSASETVNITHAASGGGYGSVTGTVGVTTTDDDAPGLTFTPGSVNVGEASTVDYTVVLNIQPTANVTVSPTSGNTNAATVSPATLIFTDSNFDTPQTITVSGVDDDNGASETFNISHAASGGGYGSITGNVGVTTTDDDTAGVTLPTTSGSASENGGTTEYTVVLDTQPGGNVTVSPTSGDSTTATVSGALIFTDSNWDTPQTITVTGVDDDIVNASDRTATISHAVVGYGSVTVGDYSFTASDDDTADVTLSATSGNATENGGTAEYTIVLDTQPTASVTVSPTSGNPDAASVSGALTFTTANWDTAQTVTVTGVNDDIDNASDRTATISHTAASSDSDYGSVTVDAYSFTATNDDTDGLSFAPGSVNVGEASTVDYTVVLDTQPSADVTVTPTSGNTDAATVSGALTFTDSNWDTAQTVTVTGVDDANSASETFNISHTASGGGYDAITGNVVVTTTDDDAPILDIGELNETVLPQVTQAIARHTQGAVARRVGQVASAGNSLTTGDQSASLAETLADVLGTQADAINAGTLSLKDLLGNTDFVLPLHAASAKGSGVASSLALWGGGEYRSLSDDEVGPNTLDWDGDLFSATLGIDANLRNNILLGVAGSWSDVDVDYQQNDNDGDYTLSLLGVHPYLAWTGKRLSWWFTGGYSDGELSISDDVNENSSDVTLLSLGTGASGVLWADQLTTLRLKGDILWAEMDVEGGDDISPYTTDVNGSRLLLEASQVHSLDGGVSLEPSLELGVRYDGGEGDHRTNMELGAGLRLRGNRLTLDGSVYALLGEDNLGDWDIREWGVRGLLRLQGGRYGEGLSFSLTPGYGAPERDAEALLWNEDANNHASNLLDTQGNHYREYAMRLDTELGYGIPAGQGMLTPYGQMSLGDGQRYRLGLRWSRTELFELELEGERRQRDSQGESQGHGQGDVDNAILLRGRLRF